MAAAPVPTPTDDAIAKTNALVADLQETYADVDGVPEFLAEFRTILSSLLSSLVPRDTEALVPDLPIDVQPIIFKAMSNSKLRKMREVNRGSRVLAETELRRRLEKARAQYEARIGEPPSKWMSLDELEAANKMQIVNALDSRLVPRIENTDFDMTTKTWLPVPPKKQVLLQIPLIEEGENAYKVPVAAFYQMYNTHPKLTIGHVHFPNGLKSIDDGAFDDAHQLWTFSLYLPDSIQYIGRQAFSFIGACRGQKRLHLPSNLKLLVEGAFSGAEIEGIVFPENASENLIQVVSGRPFEYCKKLTFMRFPASVSLECIPQTVRRIGTKALRTVECTDRFWNKHGAKFAKHSPEHVSILMKDQHEDAAPIDTAESGNAAAAAAAEGAAAPTKALFGQEKGAFKTIDYCLQDGLVPQ